MTPEEVESLIRVDSDNVSNETYGSIEKKDYPFLKKYLHDPSEGVRERLTLLLQDFSQPFCFNYYLELLKDTSASIRNLACEGIGMMGSAVDGKALLAEIKRLNSIHSDGREYGVIDLILAIGNTRNPKMLEPLLFLYQHEKDPDIRPAYQKATAKLGYKKTMHEIELELIGSDEFGKSSALAKVNYIDSPEWVEKVKPLLLDERVGWSAPMGPKRITLRVCDLAVNTMRKIDPEKRIAFPEKPLGMHYSEEEMTAIRKAYGVDGKNK